MRLRPAMLGMVVCFATMNFSFVTAMTLTSAANAIFLQYTAPIWMFLASRFFFREPVDRWNVAAVIIGLVGIGVIVGGAIGEDLPGTLLALVSGLGYAGVAIFLRILRDEDAVWLTVLNMLGSAAVLLVVLPLLPTGLSYDLSGAQWAGLVAFGILQMALPYVLFSRALKAISTQEAGLITLLEPILNPIVTFFCVGERPSLSTIIGGGIILSGLAIRYGWGMTVTRVRRARSSGSLRESSH